ncbi:MAG: asparagine synthetase B, partial [Planctomycetota bacterium]
MCGIAGFIGDPQPSRAVLQRMRDALAHRGPDGAGDWVGRGVSLVHRRLAVIAPGPAAQQPMSTDDGRFVLAYNGEVYNDDTLRRELQAESGVQRWRSSCDTESLLQWLAAGRPLAAVRGMYALALVDTAKRTLTLARDPLGIKPLFWARTSSGGVVFASELQALFEHPELSPEPDPLGVSLYLSSVRTVLGEQTLFAGVRSVEPGGVVTFDLDAPNRDPMKSRIEIEPDDGEPSD